MRYLVFVLSLALGVSIACSPGGNITRIADTLEPGAPRATGNEIPDDGAPPNTSGVGAGTGAKTGLPCEVQQLLENRCIGCHAGAKAPALLTYGDLTAKSKSDSTKTMAQVSAARMKNGTMPPPPAAPPEAAEIATFEAWLAAGTPEATCTEAPDTAPPNVDAGAGVCTSKTNWTGGNTGSEKMHPGAACMGCHQKLGGPRLDVAGTVYPTAHEPNDCDGKGPPPSLTLVITDSNNRVTRIGVNTVGNFYSNRSIAPPFHVELTDGTKTRAMKSALTAGDCNSCHTEAGANGAPGRIMAP